MWYVLHDLRLLWWLRSIQNACKRKRGACKERDALSQVSIYQDLLSSIKNGAGISSPAHSCQITNKFHIPSGRVSSSIRLMLRSGLWFLKQIRLIAKNRYQLIVNLLFHSLWNYELTRRVVKPILRFPSELFKMVR